EVVFAPALGGGEGEPVTHIGHLARPAAIDLRGALPAAEALDEPPHSQELGFGIGLVLRTGAVPLGAGAKIVLEVPDPRVRGRFGFQDDITAGAVVDPVQGMIDAIDPLPHGLPLAPELRLEVGDLADGVLVEQLLESGLEARQVIGREAVEHGAIVPGCLDARIDLPGLEGIEAAIDLPRLDDLLTQPAD